MAFSEHEIQNFVNSVKQTLTFNGSVSSAISSSVTISDLEWGYILCKVVKYFKNNLYFYIVMFSSDLY
jgi:chlorite dismutase